MKAKTPSGRIGHIKQQTPPMMPYHCLIEFEDGCERWVLIECLEFMEDEDESDSIG